MPQEGRDSSRARGPLVAGLACVLVFCCAPLFHRLGGLEQRNDEAIYSYAVDRMLEGGDWLTPVEIPDVGPFLEKPPLKFWMLASLMKSGLLPQNDWGMRFPDAVLASFAFLYIYLLGARLGGPVAGFVGVFLLFCFEPLLMEHGLRGNNMEGSLLLGYCGGIYHFFRWAAEDGALRRRQAWCVCGFFFLAFMTKFVAAFFLPTVCLAAMAVRPRAWRDPRPPWRDWLLPTAVTVALIAPWFVYQMVRDAHKLWQVLVVNHVVTRFTGVLIRSHLHPWHHYFTSLWDELQRAGSLPVVALGVTALAATSAPVTRARIPAIRMDDDRIFLARLLLLWWLLPEIVISFGTSKLFYYSYPFLPPLFIAGGLVAALLLALFIRTMPPALERLRLRGIAADRAAKWQSRRLSYVLTAIGTVCFLLAAATAYWQHVQWQLGDVRVFKNSSVWKPFAAGAGAWYFAGLGKSVVHVIGAVLIGWLLLPLPAYETQLRRLDEIDGPLRAARDCVLALQDSHQVGREGVYLVSGETDHPSYYYLWRLGPFLFPHQGAGGELARRLEVEGRQSLVVLSAEDYVFLGGMTRPSVVNRDGGLALPVSDAAKSAHLADGLPPAVAINQSVVILFPGPYASCARVVAHAGLKTQKLAALRTR